MSQITDEHGVQYNLSEDFLDGNITIFCPAGDTAFKISDSVLDLDRLKCDDMQITENTGDIKTVLFEITSSYSIWAFLLAIKSKPIIPLDWDTAKDTLDILRVYDPKNPQLHSILESVLFHINPVTELFDALCMSSTLHDLDCAVKILRLGYKQERPMLDGHQSYRLLRWRHPHSMWTPEMGTELFGSPSRAYHISVSFHEAEAKYEGKEIAWKEPGIWIEVANCFEKRITEEDKAKAEKK